MSEVANIWLSCFLAFFAGILVGLLIYDKLKK